jgi:putative transposase
MVRPLRIAVKDGWYHVINRGIERRRIFHSTADYDHFLELLGAFPERFGLLVHCFCLMPNHYHLLVEAAHLNLSQAIQWLNVSYSVWFNRKHRRVGPLFQGRFKAVLVAPDGHHVQISRYIHLNPIRTQRFGERGGRPVDPAKMREPSLLRARLHTLRRYDFSSFASYCGLRRAPAWLTTEKLLDDFGGASAAKRRQGYQHFVEQPVRAGTEDEILNQALEKLVYGDEPFRTDMLAKAKGEAASQRAVLRRVDRPDWARIKQVVAEVKGEAWEQFYDRRGDLGRELALWIGRRFGGYTLPELGEFVGISYAAVAQSVAKFESRIARDPQVLHFANKAAKILNLNLKT